MPETALHPTLLQLWQRFCVLGKMLSYAPLSAEDLRLRTHLELWIRDTHGPLSPLLLVMDKLGDKSAFTMEDWEHLSDLVLELVTPLRPPPNRAAPDP